MAMPPSYNQVTAGNAYPASPPVYSPQVGGQGYPTQPINTTTQYGADFGLPKQNAFDTTPSAPKY